MSSISTAAHLRRNTKFRNCTRGPRKKAALCSAVAALHPSTARSIRAIHAYSARAYRWLLTVDLEQALQPPPLHAPDFDIHYRMPPQNNRILERARIGRFYVWMKRRRVRMHPIVTGTQTGPDILVRCADRGLAVIEVKGQRSAAGLLPMMLRRYAHLMDHFRVYAAVEKGAGEWALWRVTPDGAAPADPEVLRG